MHFNLDGFFCLVSRGHSCNLNKKQFFSNEGQNSWKLKFNVHFSQIWCLLIFSMNAERSVTRYWFGTKMAFLWVFCLFSNLPVYVAKLRKQNKARNFEFSRQFSFVILDNLCPAFLWCFCDCFLNDIGREVCHAI